MEPGAASPRTAMYRLPDINSHCRRRVIGQSVNQHPTVTVGPEMLSALMQDQKLSPDWTAAILDSRAASLFDGKISRRGNTCVRKISVILCPQSQRARNRKFADSLLEGDGFELVVPRHESP